MIHTDMPNKKIHQGRNIKRFREMLGIKQEALPLNWAMTGTKRKSRSSNKKNP